MTSLKASVYFRSIHSVPAALAPSLKLRFFGTAPTDHSANVPIAVKLKMDPFYHICKKFEAITG
jgi:hypothetical protein